MDALRNGGGQGTRADEFPTQAAAPYLVVGRPTPNNYLPGRLPSLQADSFALDCKIAL
jgi:hypothetical protein